MAVDDIVIQFEDRSRELKSRASNFMWAIAGLLAFGVYIFFSASSLTTTDIGGRNFDERMAATRQEMEKVTAKYNALSPAVLAESVECGNAYQQEFNRWRQGGLSPDGGMRAITFERNTLPNGDEIAKRISAELERPESKNLKVVGFQMGFQGCINLPLVLPREKFSDLLSALVGQEFKFDREKFNSDSLEQEALGERSRFLDQVLNTIYSQKVQAEASGNNHVAATTNEGSNELLLRLLQTSITRFGVLAVVGFLVSILVSLYRYNIRLAAFYTARADVLRLKSDAMTVTDFAILAAALSPNLEFGKAPQPLRRCPLGSPRSS